MRLETCRHVHRVADARVGRAVLRPRIARNHTTGRDPDADLDLLLATRRLLLVEQPDQLDHLARREHGRLPVVFPWHRGAENRHQAVADHLVDDPALVCDRVHHQQVLVVEELDRLGGLA